MHHHSMRERKPIDAALRRYLDAIAPAVSAPQMGDEERATRGRTLMMQAREDRGGIPGLPNRVEIRDGAISAELTCRLYTPPGGTLPLPLLVYAHGGGWVLGSIETHDPFCRLLSEAAGMIILSVEYRLAPEHPFPAALDDVLAAYQWTAAHARELGADAQRLFLGGDSAGGNLAAVIANRICAEGEAVKPAGLMLLYPVTDHPGAEHASYDENGIDYGLDAERMHWFWQQYAADVPENDPRISPLRLQTVPALPPTLVATAEYDPLRDEGIAYAEKLKLAAVPVTHLHAPDMHHNFAVHPGTVARFPQSIAALHEFAAWLKATR
jgi:acetyl esterase